MVAEQNDDLAAAFRGFGLELLEVADDLERVGSAVGDVAELHQCRSPARPMVGGVDQPGVAGDVEPGGEVAVEVGDRDDPLLGGLRPQRGRQGHGKQGNDQIKDKAKQGRGSH